MNLFLRNQRKKLATAPGTPVYMGEAPTGPLSFGVIDYDENSMDVQKPHTIDECKKYFDGTNISWININGIHDIDVVKKAGDIFGIHPLVLEDIVNTSQRPKIEQFDDYIYIVLKMLTYNQEKRSIDSEQVSLIITKHSVITFQEHAGDVFEAIRKRISVPDGRFRKSGTDYLAYAIVDAIVDHYFVLLERIGEEIEELEDAVTRNDAPKLPQRIYQLKRMLILLRKSVWPLRELISGLQNSESKLIGKSVGVYLRDLYDHVIALIDTTETFKDVISGIRDTYMTAISNRMNNIMKVLTIIATIFIPLTFIAGIYGMNFEYMPELKWHYGYAMVWGVMGIVTLIMLIFFRKKRWL